MIKNNYKILIIGPAWIGDMVMAQTLFKLLKQRCPTAVIDVLAPEWSNPLLACMPEINQTIISPFAHGELNLRARYALGRKLRKNNYQQAIILPNSLKSALIPFFAKIPKRTGWLGEMRWGLLNDIRKLNKKKLPLMIQRFMALGLSPKENLPDNPPLPTLQIVPEKISKTLEHYKLTVSPDRPVLILCPGAEYGAAKRWPAEYFAEVAKLKTQEGWQVWLLGSQADQVIATQIQQTAANVCYNLVGKTTLADAIHLLAAAQIIVSNDSGLMHIAAALQKPLLVIYGSSSPEFTPPLTEKVEILSLKLACSPCFSRECPLGHFKCMKDLQPLQVMQAMKDLIEGDKL